MDKETAKILADTYYYLYLEFYEKTKDSNLAIKLANASFNIVIDSAIRNQPKTTGKKDIYESLNDILNIKGGKKDE